MIFSILSIIVPWVRRSTGLLFLDFGYLVKVVILSEFFRVFSPPSRNSFEICISVFMVPFSGFFSRTFCAATTGSVPFVEMTQNAWLSSVIMSKP